METAEDLQRACAILLEEYPSLYVVVSNHKMYTAGERHRSSNGATEGVQHWSDETGCYYTCRSITSTTIVRNLGARLAVPVRSVRS